MRAYRRLAALARDPAEAADAHVHLARLSAQLFQVAPRNVRWHLDVDPIEFD